MDRTGWIAFGNGGIYIHIGGPSQGPAGTGPQQSHSTHPSRSLFCSLTATKIPALSCAFARLVSISPHPRGANMPCFISLSLLLLLLLLVPLLPSRADHQSTAVLVATHQNSAERASRRRLPLTWSEQSLGRVSLQAGSSLMYIQYVGGHDLDRRACCTAGRGFQLALSNSHTSTSVVFRLSCGGFRPHHNLCRSLDADVACRFLVLRCLGGHRRRRRRRRHCGAGNPAESKGVL